jgi:hypothetical protein
MSRPTAVRRIGIGGVECHQRHGYEDGHHGGDAQALCRHPADDFRRQRRRFDPPHLRAALELSRRVCGRLRDRKEIKRFELAAVPGKEKELEGLRGAPARGLAVTPDQKTLLATSEWCGAMYAYSIPHFKHLGTVVVGSHPEWLTLTPDGKTVYVAVVAMTKRRWLT